MSLTQLSDEDINTMVERIIPIHPRLYENNPISISQMQCLQSHKDYLIKKLKGKKVKDDNGVSIELIVETLRKRSISMLVQPGESVGMITAQGVGEKQTQGTLNAFHS